MKTIKETAVRENIFKSSNHLRVQQNSGLLTKILFLLTQMYCDCFLQIKKHTPTSFKATRTFLELFRIIQKENQNDEQKQMKIN